jgi:hypothetical protein
MKQKILAWCLWCVFVFPVSGSPYQLSGTWHDEMDGERGVMEILVDEVSDTQAIGSIHLKGSRYGKDLIAFRADRQESLMVIVSTEKVVCGYQGVLRGTMKEGDTGVYTGTFTYHFWGGVWAKGVFSVNRKRSTTP